MKIDAQELIDGGSHSRYTCLSGDLEKKEELKAEEAGIQNR